MKIEKSTISTQVVDHLRKQIVLGELEEGAYLVEATLAKELDVSRGPVREAITRLEAENLVTRHSNGRTVVRRFDTTDIRNLYDSRILLETHALGQIDPALLDKKKDVLFLHIDQMQKSFELEQRDVESDLDFHGYLMKLTDNQTLIQLWMSLREVFRTLVDITSEATEMKQQQIIDQHTEIVQALIAGDVDVAKDLLGTHLVEACEYCYEGKKSFQRRDGYAE